MHHESDEEDDVTRTLRSDTGSDVSEGGARSQNSRAMATSTFDIGGQKNTNGDMEGMLPRDRPQKTAFYDPVAERQMTQTDAKLFYQRNQLEIQKAAEVRCRDTLRAQRIAVP